MHDRARRHALDPRGLLRVGRGGAPALSRNILKITPGWVPFPRQVILATGAFELAAAAALLTRQFRKCAGMALAAYTLCVWPANIKHALEGIEVAGLPSSWWYHGPRLAMQPVIIWWALFCAGVIDWPWRTRVDATSPRP